MTERELLEYLTTHFVVKDGPNKDKNQYGHLELWWAAKSVHEESSALYNPWMLLGTAENSYSLAAMGDLRGVLEVARDMLPRKMKHRHDWRRSKRRTRGSRNCLGMGDERLSEPKRTEEKCHAIYSWNQRMPKR